MIAANVHSFSAIVLAAKVRAGSLSALQACDAYLSRIAAHDPHINAFTEVFAVQARAAAAEADVDLQRGHPVGPLHGVPIAVKDLFSIAGRTTLAGSRIRVGGPAAHHDAPALARLRAAGAILLGTLNMDEFAAGFWTEHTHRGPTHNPWNLEHMAGGSSGGSAAAVAASMSAASLGTDTNGSIRVPASFCGVVGFKPTYGRIPTAGVTPLSWSLDHVGPMTRSVADARLLYHLMIGEASPGPHAVDASASSLKGLRLGVLHDDQLEVCSPEVRNCFAELIDALSREAEIVRVETQALRWSRPAADIITAVEAASYHRKDLQDRPMEFHRGIRSDLRAAALLPASAYVQAQRVRAIVRARFSALFSQVDALLVPTTPLTALKLGEMTGRNIVGHFTQPFSCAGIPALSVPIGLTEVGLPVGLTIAGPAFGDETVLGIGRALEAKGLVTVLEPRLAPTTAHGPHSN